MKYYIVDAFTSALDQGNPAGVCLLEQDITDAEMQNIAAANHFAETAFIMPVGSNYQLRWFTPTFEIDLRGHATLAAACAIFCDIELEREQLQFTTMSGSLTVRRKENCYELSLPCRPPKEIMPAAAIIEALGVKPIAIYAERDLYAVLSKEQEVKTFVPNYEKLGLLTSWLGIVITARGAHCDFVSRYFCPELGQEDSVTGSSHCSLVPLWHSMEHKTTFKARQLSPRGGTLFCEYGDVMIKLSGEAILREQGVM